MENFRSFQHQKRGLSTASPSSFARPARQFAPVPSPSSQPASLDGEAQLEHARQFEHSLKHFSIFPLEHSIPALSDEGQHTDHTIQQERSVQNGPQASMNSIAAESTHAAKRSYKGGTFAHIPLFPAPATLPSTNRGSFASVDQRLLIRGEESRSNMQRISTTSLSPFVNQMVQQQNVPPKKNSTGLPNPLKAGVENLTGLSMDDVQVHYNSPKPAHMWALAYTQGADIHVGPGQERHLPHEAWHVVQQKQGRVKPTLQSKGMAINDAEGLEREADVMGAIASSYRVELQEQAHPRNAVDALQRQSKPSADFPIQYITLYRGMQANLPGGNQPLLDNTAFGLGVRDADVTIANGVVISGGMSTSKTSKGVPGFTLSKSYQGGSHNMDKTAKQTFRWKWSIDTGALPATLKYQNDHDDHVLVEPAANDTTLANFRAAVQGTHWNRIDPP
ncbi:MAG: hypothetical protein NVSMB38_20430 [Ktedonobacteraceae bacterium]